MPLAPQHFQDSARRVECLLDYHLSLLSPYHYGVLWLDISRAKLAGGELHVHLQAIMPDHLAFSTKAGPLTLRLDPAELRKKPRLSDHDNGPDLFGVYLSVPWESPGRAAAGDTPRYRPGENSRLADDTTGDNELDIQRLTPNIRPVVDREPPTNSVWLQIAQLRLDGDAFSLTEYVPPLLVVSSGLPLYDLCSRLVERIRVTANRLAHRLELHSKSAKGDSASANPIAEIRHQLYHLTAALPVFEAMLFSERAHPFSLYLAAAAMVGQLAPLANPPVPPLLPTYEHDQLHATFREIDARIQRIIRESIQESFKARPFELKGDAFFLDFRATWAQRTLVLAVRAHRGRDESEAKRWLEGAIIVPTRILNQSVASRSLGLRRVEFKSDTGDLVPTSGETLFELKEVRNFLSTDEQFAVFNPRSDATSNRPLELVLYVEERKEPI